MTADEESIIKRQARRRLIGAIALTTAVVIILPIVFDGEPPTTKVSDIELRIPDKDKLADIPIGSAASTPGIASAAVPASAPASTAASGILPAAAAAAIVAAPVVAAAASQHAPAVKPEQPKAEAVKPAQAESKAEVKPAATHNTIPHSGFAVQVGAFVNADAAKKLQDKLVAQGLHAYTEKVGHNVRVRVGSFTTHEAADKVRHKIEAQGLHPNVVNLGS